MLLLYFISPTWMHSYSTKQLIIVFTYLIRMQTVFIISTYYQHVVYVLLLCTGQYLGQVTWVMLFVVVFPLELVVRQVGCYVIQFVFIIQLILFKFIYILLFILLLFILFIILLISFFFIFLFSVLFFILLFNLLFILLLIFIIISTFCIQNRICYL